jgi:hypothetical protein
MARFRAVVTIHPPLGGMPAPATGLGHDERILDGVFGGVMSPKEPHQGRRRRRPWNARSPQRLWMGVGLVHAFRRPVASNP